MSTEQKRTVTPAGQAVSLELDGFPDTRNLFGSGDLRPTRVILRYHPNGFITARLYGRWVVRGGMVTEDRLTNEYEADNADTRGWPDWLAELAREHAPVRPTEVEELRKELAEYEMLNPQQCPAGKHADWLVDSEHAHACPWCEIDRLKATAHNGIAPESGER